MRRLTGLLVATAAVMFVAGTSIAQQKGDGQRGTGPNRGDRTRPVHPIIAALDTDKDGVISAKEIENAVKALKALDKNSDGKLTKNEYRPGGRRPAAAQAGSQRPGGPRPGGPGRGGPNFAALLEKNDKNKDGKLTKDEVPEQMKAFFDRLDSNGDGAVDRKELDAMAKRFGGPGNRGPGGRPNRPQPPKKDK